MGSIGKHPPSPLLSSNCGRPQATAGRDPRLGANRGDHRALFYHQSEGPGMKHLQRLLIRLSNFVTRRSAGEPLQEEIAAHLTFQPEENLRAGISSAEARRQAALK